MLETSARLLRLLSLLQAPRDWSGTELADRLDVSPRTVRRDVERLRGLGYPVHATAGTAGGYRLGAGANLPPLLLDDDEAVAVAVGLRTAAGGTVTGIEETSLRALAKLEQVLPARLRHRVNALQTYTVPTPGSGPTVGSDVLNAVVAACRDRERLRFDYENHDGEPSARTVEPHRLVHRGSRWYLVAWDVDRQDWRTFRADRLRPKIPTGPRFTPRELPASDVAEYVAQGVIAALYRFRGKVRMHAPASRIVESLPPGAGTVEPVDEHTCLLEVGASSLDTISVYLGMLGIDFDVLEPPELAEHVRLLSERYRRAV